MENIVSILIGVVCITIGILNCSGNVSMLHSYHRSRVSEEDLPSFGKWVGAGTILIGISLVAMGILSYLAVHLQNNVYQTVGNAVLIAGFVLGIGISFFAMIKYNKGIF